MEATTIKKYDKKTVSALKKLAKTHFNKFIRLRDCDENGYATCISSGQPLKYGSTNFHAGHFYSGGFYPDLEFNENNVHSQGKSDNYYKGGNQLEYRKRLIKKIGEDSVKELDLKSEQSKRVPFKHNRFFLIEIIETYKAKCKELGNNKNFKI